MISQSFVSFNTKLRMMEASELKENSFYFIPEEEDSFFVTKDIQQEMELNEDSVEGIDDNIEEENQESNNEEYEVNEEEEKKEESNENENENTIEIEVENSGGTGTDYENFDAIAASLSEKQQIEGLTKRYEENKKRNLLMEQQSKKNLEEPVEEIEEFSSLWWFPSLSRGEAEQMLARKNFFSSFVIRTSSIPNHYALTRYSSGLVIHYLIEKTEEDSIKVGKRSSFRLVDCDLDQQKYPSLNTLVDSSPFLFGCKPIGLL